MNEQFPVYVDAKGYVLIPVEVRKALGLEHKSLLLLTQDGSEIRLVPGEIVPRRRVRLIPREQLAQALIDGAVTPEGLRDAREGIRKLGLDPTHLISRF